MIEEETLVAFAAAEPAASMRRELMSMTIEVRSVMPGKRVRRRERVREVARVRERVRK